MVNLARDVQESKKQATGTVTEGYIKPIQNFVGQARKDKLRDALKAASEQSRANGKKRKTLKLD